MLIVDILCCFYEFRHISTICLWQVLLDIHAVKLFHIPSKWMLIMDFIPHLGWRW